MRWIQETSALIEAVDALRDSPYLAVDTEFLRRSTYFPTLALIQLQGTHGPYLIDPLAPDLDLTPLKELFFDPSLVKVLHAASQDLEILYALFGAVPYPIMDTQILSMFCGMDENISYQKLCQVFLDVEISKTYQDMNWTKRPLTNAEKEYAADDVRHLYALYPLLVEKAGPQFAWAQEEMQYFASPGLYIPSAYKAWKRLKKPGGLTRDQSASLYYLVMWRDQKAQTSNKIPRWILEDTTLIKLAEVTEVTATVLTDLKVPPRYHEALLKVLEQAKTPSPEVALILDKLQVPRIPVQKEQIKTFKEHCLAVATAHGIPLSLLARTQDIEAHFQGGKPRFSDGWRAGLLTID